MFVENEGRIDRVLRSTLGLIVVFPGFGGVIPGTAGLSVLVTGRAIRGRRGPPCVGT